MVAVTSWASMHCPMFQIPGDVVGHPWFIATLVDAYWAFFAFACWVMWKEQRLAARGLWFLVIMLLGNMAMALYVLRELFSIRQSSEITLVFCRRNAGNLLLPAVLAGVSLVVYLVA